MIRTGITYRFKQRVTEAGAIRLFYGSSRCSDLPRGGSVAEKGWFLHFHGGGSMCSNLLIIKSYFSFHLYNIFFSLSLDQFAIN